MDASARRALQDGAERLGVTLSRSDLDGFARYLELLLTWNARINLTAIRSADDVIERHFLDSIAVAPHLRPEARALIDVGSGGGFPGAVLALLRPALSITLLEANHKKTAFLGTLKREIPLPNVTVVSERVETYRASPAFQPFDVAVSRATWDVTEWLAIGQTLIAEGGDVIAMEGAEQHDLPANATRHPYALGNLTRSIVVFHVEHARPPV